MQFHTCDENFINEVPVHVSYTKVAHVKFCTNSLTEGCIQWPDWTMALSHLYHIPDKNKDGKRVPFSLLYS